MNTLFFLLFLLSLICLIVGLIRPSIFGRMSKNKISRKKIGLIFGLATFVCLILFGLTTEPNNADNTTNQNGNNKDGTKTEEPKTETPTTSEVKQTNELPDDIYLARVGSEGEKLTQAGYEIELSGEYLDSKNYKAASESIFSASSKLYSMKLTFEAQNPSSKYKEFNNNMINLLRNLISVTEEMEFSFAEDYTSVDTQKINAASERGNRIISEMGKELDKIGL